MFDLPVTVTFYVNIGLTFCALAQGTAVAGLCKKTSYRIEFGLTAVFIIMFAFFGFIAQIVMYSFGHIYTPDMVYSETGLLGAGFVASGIYCIVLSRRSNKKRCIIAAVTSILPPVGTFFMIRLAYKMRRDTCAQGLVFNGYAYTIASLKAYFDGYVADYIDSAGEEEFERLSGKDAIKHIKSLKKQAKDAEGLFRYAEAVAYYTPVDMRLAVRAMNKSAKQGYPAAIFNLGFWHETGTYYNADLKKAREYYARAAALGDKDAEMRLAIVDIKTGKAADAVRSFTERANSGDLCAKYNLAVCIERGQGVERDKLRAIKLYSECARAGLYSAQQRIFAYAAISVNNADYDDIFKEIAVQSFGGEFGKIMRAVIAVKEKRASDAADIFLDAVRQHGRWEGVARLFVGTLYMDCGKTQIDRRNGAAYVKSAFGLTDYARELYITLPRDLTREKYKEKEVRRRAPKNNAPAVESKGGEGVSEEPTSEKADTKADSAKDEPPVKKDSADDGAAVEGTKDKAPVNDGLENF